MSLSECLLSASAGWYSSKICDGHESGLFAFGGSNSIFFVKIEESEPPKYLFHFPAHASRVTSVAISPHNDPLLCCTSGEDGKVRVHDVQTRKVQHEHSKHRGQPTVVDWSKADSDLIVSGDDHGGIFLWRISAGNPQLCVHESSSVNALSCSPHDSSLLLAGYRSGAILILNVTKNEVVHKLRGHDEDIQGLCWAPILGDSFLQRKDLDAPDDDPFVESPAAKICIVASSSKDRTVRLWSSSTSRCIQILKLPQASYGYKRHDDPAKTKVWIALHWPKCNPNLLISSSYNGDMLVWNLDKQGKFKPRHFDSGRLTRGHARNVFSLCSVGTKVISSGMDRQHIVWDLNTQCGEYSVPGLGGFAYCIAQSPVNSGRLAVGCGDNLIRIWTTDNSDNPLEVQSFWQGIKSKVTSVCWHPEKEGLLAYGTDDGRVGIYNTLVMKPPNISSTYHKRTVYVVSWGVKVCKTDMSTAGEGLVVYSVGDNVILQHNPNNLENEAVNVNTIIKATNGIEGRLPGRSEICWKPDMSLVAIGNDDGTIEIMEPPHLKKLCVLQVHRKLINVIRWHPQYTAESNQTSPLHFWLASGSNDPTIHVVNVQPHIGEDNVRVVVHSDYQLAGHTHRITDLCWSPHQQGHIASASFDNTAQVWNVLKGEALANYRGHNGRLLSVAWSAAQPDLMYSGGADNTVQAWIISKQPHAKPPDASYHSKQKFTKSKSKAKPVEVKDSEREGGGGDCDSLQLAEIQQLLEKRRIELQKQREEKGKESLEKEAAGPGCDEEKLNELLGRKKGFSSATANENADESTPQLEGYQEFKKDGKRKIKRQKALWPLSNNADNRGKAFLHQDCLDLLEYTVKGKDKRKDGQIPESHYYLGHFVNRKCTYALMDKEGAHHGDNGAPEQQFMLEMFRGNTAAMLKRIADAGQLTEFHLSLATSVSATLWRELCGKFAEQQERDGLYQRAATYHLARNDVYAAINTLANNNCYKDAVCLAQVRLLGKDPLFKQLYTDWAEHAIMEGNFEQAARCYLALSEPLEASKMLMRRCDLTALRAATYVALTSGDLEVTAAYATKYVNQCLHKLDWAAAADVIMQHECFQVHALPTCIHEILVRQLVEMKLLSSEFLEDAKHFSPQDSSSIVDSPIPNFSVSSDAADRLCVWPPQLLGEAGFVHHMIRQVHHTWKVELETRALTTLYQKLLPHRREHSLQVQTKQVLIEVSIEVALGMLKLMIGETDEAMMHWTVAISNSVQADHHDIAIGLCRLILPLGPSYVKTLERQVKAVLTSCDPKKTQLNSEEESSDLDNNGLPNDDSEHLIISSDSVSQFDSIKAYYALCVLLYFERHSSNTISSQCVTEGTNGEDALQNQSAKVNGETATGEQVSKGSETTEAAEQNTTDLVQAVEAISLESKTFVDPEVYFELSRSLLKDSLVLRFKFQDSLSYIQKAVARLINKHAIAQTSNNRGNDLGVTSNAEGNQERELKDNEKTDCDKSLEDKSKDCTNADPDAREKEATSSQVIDKDCVTLGDVVLVDSEEKRNGQTTIEVEVHEEKPAAEPELFMSLPIDECYEQDGITLTDLTTQQAALNKLLRDLAHKNVLFPHVLSSLKKLMDALDMIEDSATKSAIRHKLLQWGTEQAYTQEMKNWLHERKTAQ